MRGWYQCEGIYCFSTYEEMQGLSSQNQFLKISNYPDFSHQSFWSTEWVPHFCSQPWTPFRACQRLTAAAAQDSVSAEADGKCPWQVPICSWKTQGGGHWNFWYRVGDRSEAQVITGLRLASKVENRAILKAWNSYLWKVKWVSQVWLFATLWTIQSMEFSRPEYWSG